MPSKADRQEARSQAKQPLRGISSKYEFTFVVLHDIQQNVLLSTPESSGESLLRHIEALLGSNYGQVLGALSYNSTRVLAFDLPSSECLLIMPQESATQLSSSMMFTDQFRWKGHTPVLDQAFSMLTQPSRFPFDAVKSELEDLELTPSQTKPDASSASTS